MKLTLQIIIFFVILSCRSMAQIPIGYYFDNHGMPFADGVFEPLDYFPRNGLKLSKNLEPFQKGYYLDSQGLKKNGYINFNIDQVIFKKQKYEEEIVLELNNIKNFVIGTDSFIVIKNKIRQFIDNYKNLTFYKSYRFELIGNNIVFNYFVEDNGSILEIPKNSTEFQFLMLQYFGGDSYLRDQLRKGRFSYGDFPSLLKNAKYKLLMDKNIPVLYNKHWQEVDKKKDSYYEARLLSRKDSIWTIEYYKDSIKLFSAQYGSISPKRLHGEFVGFYPNGKIRKKSLYSKNDVKVVETYYPEGELHYQYKINRFINESDSPELIYYVVNNSNGQNLIQKEEEFEEHFYDEITKREMINHFKGNKLLYAYHIKDGKKIYQTVDSNFELKLYKLQSRLNKKNLGFLENMKEIHGTYLVHLQINADGTVSNLKVLNKINFNLDRFVKNFMNSNLGNASYNPQKFNKYKVAKEKVSYELVIPISINFSKFFSRNNGQYNFFYDPMWQQMRHDQMMNSLNNIPQPNFIR